MDALGSVNQYCVGQAMDDEPIDLLGELTERYETYKDLE